MTFVNEVSLSGRIKFGKMDETKTGKKVFKGKIGFGNKEKGYQDISITGFGATAQLLASLEAKKEPVTVNGFLKEERYTGKDGTVVSKTLVVVLDVSKVE